ncbi:MAG: DUF1684 domain-containing protein [Bacteroidota bacterium]
MVFLLFALGAVAAVFDASAHRREVEAWQKARDTRLRADGGWLTLAGLFWLKPGVNRFGTAADCDLVFPAGTASGHAGSFVLDKDGGVTVEMAPGVSATVGGKAVAKAVLRSDAGAAVPDLVTLGSLTMQIIERHGRRAVRLRDANSKTRRDFKSLAYFPVDPRLRVVARFVAHPVPVSIAVPNVLGFVESLPSPGYATFSLGGRAFRLDPVLEAPGDTQLFFIFRDQTAGKTTYGAGRFMYTDLPRDGQVVLDFNKAYSPPCAFTPYATCPLPPDGNRLPIAVEAGERFDGGHGH